MFRVLAAGIPVAGRVTIVAGTPGTGKTTLGRLLARALGSRLLRLSSMVVEYGAWSGYDKNRKSFIIDLNRVCNILRAKLSRVNRAVFETHWPGVIEECGLAGIVEGVVVTRCRPSALLHRLRRRGWSCRKVIENIESEALAVVANEAYHLARQSGAWFYEVDTCIKGCGAVCYEFREGCCLEFVNELPMLGLDACQ